MAYASSQVGNQDFADYVDAHVTSFTRINNKEDPIPIVPGRFLGFHHPSGEVHVTGANVWEACPGMYQPKVCVKLQKLTGSLGQDNTSTLCIVGDVPNIFDSDESDHDGPYDGIEMGC